MRKFVLVFAMVLVSAGAQAGQLRSLSLAGSESKTVQEPAKSVEPASAIETPRTPRTPKATEATEATGATEKQKFAERPPGVDVSRQSQSQSQMQSRMPSRVTAGAMPRRAPPRMARGDLRRPHHKHWSAARIVATLHRYGIYW